MSKSRHTTPSDIELWSGKEKFYWGVAFHGFPHNCKDNIYLMCVKRVEHVEGVELPVN